MVIRITKIDQELHDRLQTLGSKFLGEKLGRAFILEKFLSVWSAILTMGTGALWTFEVDGKVTAMLGMVITCDLYDGSIVVQQLFWYSDKSCLLGGIRLFEEMMSWARTVGARRVTMGHLLSSLPEKFKRFYYSEGFRPTEIHYVKELA